jgi:hypothetical protein
LSRVRYAIRTAHQHAELDIRPTSQRAGHRAADEPRRADEQNMPAWWNLLI